MELLTREEFYFCVVALVVLMRVQFAFLARSSWFGFINFVALFALFGFKVAAGAFIAVLLLWAILRLQQQVRHVGVSHVAPAATIAIYMAVILLFLGYKSAIDHSAIIDWGKRLAGNVAPVQHVLELLVAVSFSYVFLRMLDVINSVLHGQRLLGPLALYGYLVPFFMLPAGPVAAYSHYVTLDTEAPVELGFTTVLEGINTITTGLFLKLVAAEAVRMLVMGADPALETGGIVRTGYFLLYMYLEFAGYSLVAMGIGQLAGIPTPANFNKPFLAKSVTEFWARWHISLGELVKRLIFIPVQVRIVRRRGIKSAYWANLVALLLSFAFTGLWHRMSLMLLVWGVMNGTLVALEKVIGNRFKHSPWARTPFSKGVLAVLMPIYTITAVTLALHISLKDMLQR